ncbi:glycoside hydrolase family 72 protein [Lentithecium fluviatile CBS 122367]|uniref:1,3-beta-glucanosyltransferase n=1 Tax=Lentithecium fluviatile CBS 122367 TaxID=1168545 RepID=A0A6G1IFE8_9PLEO|nr:glycoside hydrolase family 72 protein [Lentithecium fluviatile CBS 122367]
MAFSSLDIMCCWLFLISLLQFGQAEVDPIVIKGSHFFYKTNGTAFFIRGLSYYPFGIDGSASLGSQFPDPLADETICRRDIPYLLALGINTILPAGPNQNLDHTACMNAFADAGIYVLKNLHDVTEHTVDGSIPGWDDSTMEFFKEAVDSFAKFPNTLGFTFRAIASSNNDFPFAKAAIRDIKDYINSTYERNVPAGWWSGDASLSRHEYMTCNDSKADFVIVLSYAGSD